MSKKIAIAELPRKIIIDDRQIIEKRKPIETGVMAKRTTKKLCPYWKKYAFSRKDGVYKNTYIIHLAVLSLGCKALIRHHQ